MPDWGLHLGSAYVGSKFFKVKDVRWILLGSLLPDIISRVAYVLFDLLPFKLNHQFFHLYLNFYHTPFMVLFASIIIALLTKKPYQVFCLIYLSSLLHIFLDLFQKNVGGGSPIFFPFKLSHFSFQLFWYDNPWIKFIFFITLLMLILMFFKERRKFKTVALGNFSFKKLGLFLTVLLFFIFFPFLFVKKGLEKNIFSTSFIKNPQAFEGKEISLSVSKIVKQQQQFYIKEGSRIFLLTSDQNQNLKEGDWVSIRGIYRQGEIFAHMIHKHDYYFKIKASLLGGVLFFFFFFFYHKKEYDSKKK